MRTDQTKIFPVAMRPIVESGVTKLANDLFLPPRQKTPLGILVCCSVCEVRIGTNSTGLIPSVSPGHDWAYYRYSISLGAST